MLLPPGRFLTSDPDEYLLEICPLCGKPDHFFWNVVKAEGVCKVCHGTIKSQSYFDYIHKNALQQHDTKERIDWGVDLDHPLRSQLSHVKSAWDYLEARVILEGRHVSEETDRQVPLQYLPEKEWLVCPLDALSPELPAGMCYRSLFRWPPKWFPLDGQSLTRYGFGIRHLRPDLTRLLLVEGIYDLLSTSMLGFGVSMMGTACSSLWMTWIRSRRLPVAVWFDWDSAGQDGTKKMVEQLSRFGIDVLDLTNRAQCDPKNVPAESDQLAQLRKFLTKR